MKTTNTQDKLLAAYNCYECGAERHRTGGYVTCPNCNYIDETNMGTGYDYLYGGEFLDSYCRNCGVRLQATYRLSTSWITHLVYPLEVKVDYKYEKWLSGHNSAWDYEENNVFASAGVMV